MKWLVLVPLVLLVCAEIGLRFIVGLGDPPLAQLDPDIEYMMVPNGDYSRWGNTISINNVGLRGPDIAPDQAPDSTRILLIGDSVVYGTNRIDQSETIAANMNRTLQNQFADCKANVIAVAASSWGPANQRAYLSRHSTMQANQAMIVLSAHDLYDVPTPQSQILPYRLAPSWTAIGDAVTGVLERRAPAVQQLPLDMRRQLSTRALQDMLDDLRRDGIDATIVYHPTVPEYAGNVRDESAVFQGIAEKAGVTFFDLGTQLDPDGAYRDHIHPNAIGAERVANALLPWISC